MTMPLPRDWRVASFAPRRNPHAAPGTGIFDAPAACVTVSLAWVAHLLGALETLAEPQAWQGDDGAKAAAVVEIEKLLNALCEGCVPVSHRMVGEIVAWAGAEIPAGWLPCSGQHLSRTEYAALFAVIGTAYGSGDGTTTFALPNISQRVIVGAGTGGELSARDRGDVGGTERVSLTITEMPPHTHTVKGTVGGGGITAAAALGNTTTQFDLNVGARGAGASHENMPPFAVAHYIIYTGVGG